MHFSEHVVLLKGLKWKVTLFDDDNYFEIEWPKELHYRPSSGITGSMARNEPVQKPEGSVSFAEFSTWIVAERERKLRYARTFINRTLMKEYNIEFKCRRQRRRDTGELRHRPSAATSRF